MTHPSPISAAISQLGVQEATGNNDGIPAKRYMRGDKLAWCAGFVLWCYDEADESLYKTDRGYYDLRNVQKMEDEMKRRGVWFGPRLWAVIQPGDIIFFQTRGGSDSGPGRHVGLAEATDLIASVVNTIEGNSSNKVRRRQYPLAAKKITGYARPIWYQ